MGQFFLMVGEGPVVKTSGKLVAKSLYLESFSPKIVTVWGWVHPDQDCRGVLEPLF